MREDHSLEHLVRVYLDASRDRRLAAETVAWQRRALALLTKHLARRRIVRATQVQERHLVEWLAGLTEIRRGPPGQPPRPRFAPATRLNIARMVRAFFGWLCTRGALLMDPARELVPRRNRANPIATRAIPTESEVTALFERLPRGTPTATRDRAILELMYSSGLRTSEVRMLNLYDLELDAGTVRIRSGKGGKDRVVPVGETALGALAAWLELRPAWAAGPGELALFVTRFGRRMTRQTIGFRLRFMRAKFGLPLARLHDLRHACAVHLLRRGADVRHIQELLGHARSETTAIYTQLAPADLKAAHRRCHPRERGRRP